MKARDMGKEKEKTMNEGETQSTLPVHVQQQGKVSIFFIAFGNGDGRETQDRGGVHEVENRVILYTYHPIHTHTID